MNIRLQKYKKNRIIGMNQYNAARSAGYSERMARDHSYKLEKAVSSGMRDELDKAGLTDRVMSQQLTALALKAKKIHGSSDDFIEIDDNTSRLKAIELAGKFKGTLALTDKTVAVNVLVMNSVKIGDTPLEFDIGEAKRTKDSQHS